MKAKISNNTKSPKGFYLGFKQITVHPGKSIEGDYEDALLQSLKDTGFDVAHEGKLKLADAKPSKADTKAITDAAKVEAETIVSTAKAEAEKILSAAKEQADKIISEAEELVKK